MQSTSKWQTHLLHLHLETFKNHNSFSENYKNSNKKPAHRRHILSNRVSQVCRPVESCGKSLVRPTGPMNVTMSRQKIFITNSVPITLLKFARSTYPGPKMFGNINQHYPTLANIIKKKDNFRAEKLAKSANYARSAFFRKYMKIMLLNRNDDGNYAKNYASTIYRSFIFTLYALSFWSTFKSVFKSTRFR